MNPFRSPFWKFTKVIRAGRGGVEEFIRQHLMSQMATCRAVTSVTVMTMMVTVMITLIGQLYFGQALVPSSALSHIILCIRS